MHFCITRTAATKLRVWLSNGLVILQQYAHLYWDELLLYTHQASALLSPLPQRISALSLRDLPPEAAALHAPARGARETEALRMAAEKFLKREERRRRKEKEALP